MDYGMTFGYPRHVLKRDHQAIALLSFIVVSVPGQALGGESGRCLLGSHWVKQHFRKAYHRADGTYVSATSVQAHCSKNPAGFDFWSPRLKPGRPAKWPFKREGFAFWSEEDRERVLEALSPLPPELRELAVKGLYRMKKSIHHPNAASGDPQGNIVLYDAAFDLNNNLSQILAHELAHRIYRNLSLEEADDYRGVALWWNRSADPNNPKWVSLSKGFVAPDWGDSPEEDFSNNVEYYLFNPGKLKAVSPLAHDWIRSRFGANFKLGKANSQ